MLTRILAIPSTITTPIALAALVVTVLYLVYKLIFENKLIPKIPTEEGAKVVKRIVDWLGVLATIALIFAMAPPLLRIAFAGTPQNDITQVINAMYSDYNQGSYDAASSNADDVLKLDPDNSRALNMKASIMFYKGDFRGAAETFQKALDHTANDSRMHRLILKNLADAHVELGQTGQAIGEYKSVEDQSQDWTYSVGRAYLYNDDFQSALDYLKGLPATYHQGSAKILAAAALVGLSQSNADPQQRATLIAKAKASLDEGVTQAPDYWGSILTGKKTDIHEGYSKAKSLLGDLYEQQMAKQR